MALKPSKHIIAARNPFFGTSYFLILPLPDGWRITRSYLSPDIHSSVKRENLTWVEAGQTDQIVFHPAKRIALDLMIQIKRGKHDGPDLKGMKITSRGSQDICNHQALYFVGEVKQGLFQKRTVNRLCLFFYCPELQRTIFLHLTGRCHDDELMELRDFFSSLECH